jgi:serine/threonine protein kinase/CheY-like chemotaxis protein
VSALEGDGWEVQWLNSADAPSFLNGAQSPDLLVLDASVSGGAGYLVAQSLRGRKPGLPVLVLSDESAPGSTHKGQPLGVQAFLQRDQPEGSLVAALRRHRAEEPKFTTDDIFADLIADIEGTAVPTTVVTFSGRAQGAGQTAPPAPVAQPAQAVRPVAQAAMSSADIFGSVIDEIESDPRIVPDKGKLPVPVVKVDSFWEAKPQSHSAAEAFWGAKPSSPAPAEQAEPLDSAEFTLSGISGVHDPFEWVEPMSTPSIEAPQPPAPRPSAQGTSEVIEEYGNYFLLEKIAVGGMAELFKAQQRGVQGFQKIVAIKRILPHFSDNEDFVTMFIDEAKLAAQLTHPNIVQIFDLGKAGTSYYIAMEYVNGRDLRTLLRKVREYGTAIPEQVAAFIVMKVAAALDYAHRKRGFDDRELKLVHRDISPQNVILSTEGAVKLVDFGIAKAASKASHTVAGALKGKLLYMSPEQATGQPLDNRSDLYSLGLVLFELLTGERCFQADSELGVLEKVRLGRISDLTMMNPNVSREIAAIVSRSLQKGVDHRYPSARFMERDLRDYLQRQGTPITEHDVAEYMTTLLKGSKEELEILVSAKFPMPLQTSLSSGTHRVLAEQRAMTESRLSGENRVLTDETSALTAAQRGPSSRDETAIASPLDPTLEEEKPTRPRWLLPAILTLAVILIIMLIVATWS